MGGDFFYVYWKEYVIIVESKIGLLRYSGVSERVKNRSEKKR